MPKHDTLEIALSILEDARASIGDAIKDIREEIERMQNEIEGLNDDVQAAEDGRNSAQSRLDEIEGTPELRDAAETLMSEAVRPVGKIYELQLPDGDASRRALLMLSDALGRHIP